MRTNLDDSQGNSNYESSQPPDTQDHPGGPPSKAAVDAAERLSAKREWVSVYTGNPSNDVSWTSTHCPVYLTSNPISATPVRPHDSVFTVSGVSGRIAATRGERGSAGTPVSFHSRRFDDPTVSPCSVSGVSDIVAATRIDKSGSACTDQIGDTNRGDQSAFSAVSSVSVTRVDHLGSACTSVSSSRRRGDDPTDGDHRVSTRGTNRSAVCPPVSPFSVPGVSGIDATTRADQVGSACDV